MPHVNRSHAHTAILIVSQVLLLIAVAVLARMLIMTFGQVAAIGWARAAVAATDPFVLPMAGVFGLYALLSTPFSGVLDVNAGMTFFVILIARWGCGYLQAIVVPQESVEQD